MESKEDLFIIQKEMLECSIKAGRRMAHDYKHILAYIPKDCWLRKDFTERCKMWESIFYPENGVKDYRNELHSTIEKLEFELQRATKLLEKNGITYLNPFD